jgi:hypothetical protein
MQQIVSSHHNILTTLVTPAMLAQTTTRLLFMLPHSTLIPLARAALKGSY